MTATPLADLQLGPQLYTCHVKTCRHQGPASDFTLNAETDSREYICNTCTIRRSSFRFIQVTAIRPDWMNHPYRGCSPKALAEEGLSQEAFFPDAPRKVREAPWKPLCSVCPVMAQCGLYGRQTGSQGVWGGELLGGVELKFQSKKLADVPLEERNKLLAGSMLSNGKCKHGHIIASDDDIVVTYTSRYGHHVVICAKCKKINGDKYTAKKAARMLSERQATIEPCP